MDILPKLLKPTKNVKEIQKHIYDVDTRVTILETKEEVAH